MEKYGKGRFLREAIVLLVAGVLLGVPLALTSVGTLKSLLYGLQPNDSTTLFLIVGSLLTVGFVAAALPTRKATQVEPSEALRYEKRSGTLRADPAVLNEIR